MARIHCKLFKCFADIFLHGAKHPPAAKPSSSPTGDPEELLGLCSLGAFDGERVSNRDIDGTVLHLFC